MVFVYRGAGKNQKNSKDPVQRNCIKFACAIQVCLSKNGSNETKCQDYIKAWKDCKDQVINNLSDDERISYMAEHKR